MGNTALLIELSKAFLFREASIYKNLFHSSLFGEGVRVEVAY